MADLPRSANLDGASASVTDAPTSQPMLIGKYPYGLLSNKAKLLFKDRVLRLCAGKTQLGQIIVAPTDNAKLVAALEDMLLSSALAAKHDAIFVCLADSGVPPTRATEHIVRVLFYIPAVLPTAELSAVMIETVVNAFNSHDVELVAAIYAEEQYPFPLRAFYGPNFFKPTQAGTSAELDKAAEQVAHDIQMALNGTDNVCMLMRRRAAAAMLLSWARAPKQ